jgi:hypothetical protein
MRRPGPWPTLPAPARGSTCTTAAAAGSSSWRPLHPGVGELILVAIFDEESSLGVVDLFFSTLQRDISALPEFQVVLGSGGPGQLRT